jgi:hypothetical protein
MKAAAQIRRPVPPKAPEIERHRDGGGWVYDDPDLHNIAVEWMFDHGFSLADFDDWIEAPYDGEPGKRAELLHWRHKAIEAQRRGNIEAVEGWLMFLRTLLMFNLREQLLHPLARCSKRFADQWRGHEGELKKRLRQVLPAVEKKLRRKASAAELWIACAARPGRNLQFYGHDTSDRTERWHYIEAGTDRQPGFDRFRKAVSEVRKAISEGR